MEHLSGRRPQPRAANASVPATRAALANSRLVMNMLVRIVALCCLLAAIMACASGCQRTKSKSGGERPFRDALRQVVGPVHPRDSVASLAAMLTSDSESVRNSAVVSIHVQPLGELEGLSVALLPLLSDPRSNVRRDVLRALLGHDGELTIVWPHVEGMALSDDSADVQYLARRLLKCRK